MTGMCVRWGRKWGCGGVGVILAMSWLFPIRTRPHPHVCTHLRVRISSLLYPKSLRQVELTLEELYKGASRKVRLNRQKVVDRRLVLEPKILEAGSVEECIICVLGRGEAMGRGVEECVRGVEQGRTDMRYVRRLSNSLGPCTHTFNKQSKQATFDKGMKDGSRIVLAGEAEGLGMCVTFRCLPAHA